MCWAFVFHQEGCPATIPIPRVSSQAYSTLLRRNLSLLLRAPLAAMFRRCVFFKFIPAMPCSLTLDAFFYQRSGRRRHSSRSSRSSSSRSRKRRKRSRRREPTPSSSSSSSDSENSSQYQDDEERPTSSSHRKRRREPEPHVSKSRRRVTRTPSPSPDERMSPGYRLPPLR